jgi:hypothetical protein
VVRQGDAGFFASQSAKQSGIRDPDHDPFVIAEYLKQAKKLARAALKYYSILM